LGPRGRNVVIEKKFRIPTITKDVSRSRRNRTEGCAREHGRADGPRGCFEDFGRGGDGTTTATVLAQAIYREGVKTVAAGANPMALKRGIEKAIAVIAGEIDKKTGERGKGKLDDCRNP